MNQKKFLGYCPNCNNYDETTGVCSYFHENIQQYPEKFMEFCDGKFLSMIKGRRIEPLNKIESDEADTDEDNVVLTSVFNSTDNMFFLMAKSALKLNGVKFWSNGEFIPPNIVIQSAYFYKIKVFKKDEKAALKIINDLQPESNQHIPTNESDKKLKSFIVSGSIPILVLIITIIIIIIILLRYF